MRVQIEDRDYSDYEELTITNSSAVGFTSSKLEPTGGDKAREAYCRLEPDTGPIRIRLDGTDPTASVGMIVQSGEAITIRGMGNLKRFRAIATSATDGKLSVHYGYGNS